MLSVRVPETLLSALDEWAARNQLNRTELLLHILTRAVHGELESQDPRRLKLRGTRLE
jgi:hypothetical protein